MDSTGAGSRNTYCRYLETESNIYINRTLAFKKNINISEIKKLEFYFIAKYIRYSSNSKLIKNGPNYMYIYLYY